MAKLTGKIWPTLVGCLAADQETLCKEAEHVLGYATKLVQSITGKESPDRLAALNLPSLKVKHRWKQGDMINLYKY